MKNGSSNRDGRIPHYIPGLDGLRALAVIAVLGYHLFPVVIPGGYIGVDIFFVISGFLITSLFITEHAKTGKIDLRQFWYRRARRLLPALVTVIGITCAIALFVGGDILVGIGRQILGALTFSNNWLEIIAGSNYFDNNAAHLFTNFWSLAVEEQFYLVWPLAIVLLLGVSWFRKRPKLSMLITVSLAIISAVLMANMFRVGDITRVYYGSDTHVFGLMIGACIAFWTRSKTSIHALRRLHQPFWWLAHAKYFQLLGAISLAGIIVLLLTMADTNRFTYYGGLPLASVLSAIVIVATVSKRDMLQHLFTLRPLEWIGVRSYGIYLWHWPLLVLANHALPTTISRWIVLPGVLLLTIACAALSYTYIEAPIRRRGFRAIISRSSPGRSVPVYQKIRPYPVLAGCLIIVGMTTSAVISAPSKTQAQLRVEAGQRAIKNVQAQPHKSNMAESQSPAVAGVQTQSVPTQQQPITGNDITIVGDSVTLASAPALQERFPGILIDAEVSRSMRRGGIETVDNLNAAGNLRKVVVIALATNGYFGAGNLDNLVTEFSDRKIVFVTAHVDREWTIPNNNDLHTLMQKYHNVSVAEWDAMITGHPEDLGDDGIHPTAQGGTLYADCIAKALGI